MASRIYLIPAMVLLLGSCASKRTVYSVDSHIRPPQTITWEPQFPGIEIAEIIIYNPPVRAWAVRVDLHNPDLDILVTPGGDFDQQELSSPEVMGRYTSSFARDYNTDVAVNASPFFPYAAADRSPQTVAGLAVSGGIVYSPADKDRAAVLYRARVSGGYEASIQMPPFNLDNVEQAAGGFFMVLDNGTVVAAESKHRHPMNLIGLDASGRHLVMLLVDGRQPNWSVGITALEGAIWLKALGCDTGMNFDGGGSVTLVVKDAEGEPSVVNRPVDYRIIGKQRVVANHLGFRVSGGQF